MTEGVYIKGMEMPKSCSKCFLKPIACKAIIKRERERNPYAWIPANYRHNDCPLVEIKDRIQCMTDEEFLDYMLSED